MHALNSSDHKMGSEDSMVATDSAFASPSTAKPLEFLKPDLRDSGLPLRPATESFDPASGPDDYLSYRSTDGFPSCGANNGIGQKNI